MSVFQYNAQIVFGAIILAVSFVFGYVWWKGAKAPHQWTTSYVIAGCMGTAIGIILTKPIVMVLIAMYYYALHEAHLVPTGMSPFSIVTSVCFWTIIAFAIIYITTSYREQSWLDLIILTPVIQLAMLVISMIPATAMVIHKHFF